MAKLFPTNIPEDIPASESRLLELISSDLDDEYTAVWSVKTVGKNDSGKMVVGEADVVLLHPRRGLLVIEAKGGGIGYDGETRRYRAHDQYGGTHWIDDPFDQASKRKYDLIKRIQDKNICPALNGDFPCAYGHAVVFPDCRIGNADMPTDAPRDIILDIEDMDFFRSRIERVYTHWRMQRDCRDLTDEEYRCILDRVLMPSFNLSYALSAELSTGHRDIVRLTKAQCDAMDMLDELDRALVRGTAGTGKTFLLVEKARRLYQEKKRVLILCFNKPLSKYLQAAISESGAEADVLTFHEFCRNIVEQCGQGWNVPEDDEQKHVFFSSELPTLAFDCVEKYPKRWDAILVDEGQDFDSIWWPCIEGVLSGDNDVFFVFYDPSQQIYDVEARLPFAKPTIPVKDNCRNTANICHLLKATMPECDFHIRESAPTGRTPRFIRIEDVQQGLQAVDKIVENLIQHESISPDQIVILSHRTQLHSMLAGRQKVGRCELVELDNRQAGAIAFSTISRFKGLESDVIILIDVRDGDTASNPKHLYTAFSRAKQLLYVIHEPSYEVPKAGYEPGSQPAPIS